MTASFHAGEGAPDVQAAVMPVVPPPGSVASDGWSDVFDRRVIPSTVPGACRAWVRVTGPLDDDPLLHACGLAYASDDMPTDAVIALHPDHVRPGGEEGDREESGDRFMAASLDHAIWFHRPVRADRWHLHALRAEGLLASRGVTVGHVFTEDGVHVATVAQEVLVRRRRTG